MNKQQNLIDSIAQASKVIGKTWPLYSFVTSNPLTGYEQKPFLEAVQQAKHLLNARVFPEAAVYDVALLQGSINRAILIDTLNKNGFTDSPENYLALLHKNDATSSKNDSHQLDRIIAKWLAAYMDEGLAEWEMPNKEKGLYGAWRSLAAYDKELKISKSTLLPKTSIEAIEQVMEEFPETAYESVFTYHLAALPGWTGYLNHRSASNTAWQEQFPVSVEDYLAIRLTIAKQLGAAIAPKATKQQEVSDFIKLQYAWLQAWEQSFQRQLLDQLATGNASLNQEVITSQIPDAQLVFCIDTRSELIRRHVEAQGNYETFGYAGFFGIAMDYTSIADGIVRKSCPPIVGSAFTVTESAQNHKHDLLDKHRRKTSLNNFQHFFLDRMKGMLPSAFGYVEGTGLFYGLSIFDKTLLPRRLYTKLKSKENGHEDYCEPAIHVANAAHLKEETVTLQDKVGIVKSAFDLTGWKAFAPLVIFAGHGSHSTNNPFGSSLDCGACAASPGRHNARMLATLANIPEVRAALRANHGIDIPNNTVFLGAEHNTTTDEIVLFDSHIPESHKQLVADLKERLLAAQKAASLERLQVTNDGVKQAEYKAGNWSETRPEWGLAKNAGFIVGPRSLTKKLHLESRCFLHSYNWQTDITGQALEAIMQGPIVVTQWINNHYYFATVDNDTFGGGNKITHNITGKFGVVLGNGGDLKMGLPLQSVNKTDELLYHEPLRLSVIIEAPLARVIDILTRNPNLQTLLDNNWIYLFIIDPTDGFKKRQYQSGIAWTVFET